MDIELALISKALTTGELSELVARGIEPDHFYDEDLADLYEWAVQDMAEHAQPPSMAIAKEEFNSFRPLITKEPVSRLMQRFVRQVKERLAVELVRAYHDALEDPAEIDEIEERAMEMARELAEVVPAPKAKRLSEGKLRKQEYDRRKKLNIVLGINIGIPTFDNITLGLQPHELLIWGGPPGGGKTTGLQYTGAQAYMVGKSVLFVSLEVEAEQILRKFDTLFSNIRYHALKALDLNPEEERRWTEVLERCEAERTHKDIVIIDDMKNATVDKIAAQQVRYRPGMVVVDYLEEMRAPRNVQGWEGVAANGRGLKQQARVTKTPHVTATQLNREGETAYQSAQKIADMLIILQPPDEDDEDADLTKMKLLLRKYRDGPSRKPALMHWDLEFMDIHEDTSAVFDRKRKLAGRSRGERNVDAALRLGAEARSHGRINPWTARHRNGHGT